MRKAHRLILGKTTSWRCEAPLGAARAIGNDDPVLVQVERFSGNPGDAALVTLRTPAGIVSARLAGSLEAAAGEHHVEWELDEEFRWGFNCLPAAVEQARLYQEEHGVFCRGRLGLTGIEARIRRR